MQNIDRLYKSTEAVLRAFNTLGPSTNAQIAQYLQLTPDNVLKGVVRYRAEGLLEKISSPKHREGTHALTLKGVEKLAKPRRIRKPATLVNYSVMQNAKSKVCRTPNSIFSMAACMGLAQQPIYLQGQE